MALRGGSGFKLKLSRPMLIIIGVCVLFVVAIVVLSFALPRGKGGGTAAAPPKAPSAKAGPTAAGGGAPYPPATEVATQPGVQPTAPQPTALPATATQPAVPPVATQWEKTPIPAPTKIVAAAPSVTPLPSGGQLPGTSGGGMIFWLIPIGAILLVAVVWWRWRRARAAR